jgi:glutamyl-Q tRNA(Asp) synthetase
VSYVGRFAPSPTGPLHVGSLVTAVASYLHARQAGGEWLVRIEDIDPPREAPGSADQILRTLEAFDLEWDRTVLRQSTRLARFTEVAELLIEEQLAFRCACSRSVIRSAAGVMRYPGTCRAKRLRAPDTAIRALVDVGVIAFTDRLQGVVAAQLDETSGDYVIFRRDGLPAYHLAVVVDDADQGVTSVVRGADLLDSTAAHIHLQRALKLPTPAYWHLPVVVDHDGQKLSKQTGATPVTEPNSDMASRVLELLGVLVPPSLRGERPRSLWEWARQNWRIEVLCGRQVIVAQ